jgi:hypothetical protein
VAISGDEAILILPDLKEDAGQCRSEFFKGNGENDFFNVPEERLFIYGDALFFVNFGELWVLERVLAEEGIFSAGVLDIDTFALDRELDWGVGDFADEIVQETSGDSDASFCFNSCRYDSFNGYFEVCCGNGKDAVFCLKQDLVQ